MGQSYDRRINMYINIDGKDVVNSVRSIRAEMNKLIGQQSNMTVGSEDYVKATRSIQRLKGILKTHAEDIGRIETPMQKAISTAKGLLPAFSFAAIGAGAKYAFDQVVNSTDVLSTKWAVFTGGLKSGMAEFWRTIAVGDWSNFSVNMAAAIKVGREYETMLDDIEEKTRSLRIKEAEAQKAELDLEEKLKNKGLSKAERLQAGQERIRLEETLAKERVKVAQDTFDAELKVTMQQTRLSKDKLMEVVSDMDSETKIKAKAYNEQLGLYESTLKKNELFKVAASRSGITENPFAKEIEDSKAALDSYPESVKVYAEAITGVGKTTDDQLNKMVSGYEGLLSAQNSAAENTKKVRTMVNSLLAGKEDGGEPTTPTDPANAKTATDALDLAYKQQQLILKQKYAGDETIQKEYHVRMLANELAYMQAKVQITTDESLRIDLQSQIIDKQREFTTALKEATPELLLNRDGINQRNASLFEEAKLLGLASQKQEEGADAMEQYTAKQQMQTQSIQGMADIMTGYISDALNGSIDEYQTFGDTMILMSLQMLKMMVPIWSAMILGYSLADPISVATVGVKGMINFAIVNGLLLAGISAVEGAVKGGISKKKEAASETPKHAAGGFTNGEGIYIAGEKGQEWIAPNWMTTHPLTGPIIAGMENWRRNPIVVSQGAIESTQRSVKSPKFKSSNTSANSGLNVIPGQSAVDPELKNILTATFQAVQNLMNWNPSISVEYYESKRRAWEKITNSGLHGDQIIRPINNRTTINNYSTTNNTTRKSIF